MNTTKKVILFIVEGQSEETAFAMLFERLFDQSLVLFDVVRGDLTTRSSYYKGTQHHTASNARNDVRDRVLDHIKQRKQYRWDDLLRIVQITDSDGTFVSSDTIIETAREGIAYYENKIETASKSGLCRRNDIKSKALRQLYSCSHLTYRKHEVPYAIYYLSRNMEHALHGCTETLSDDEKRVLARTFQRTYKNDLSGFVRMLQAENLATKGNYQETWHYIQEAHHSLERHSNLHLVLPGE